MSHLQTFAKDLLYKSALPLGIRGVCYSLEKIIESEFYHQQDGIKSFSFMLWVKRLNYLFSHTYNDMTSFILTMTFLSLFITFINMLYQWISYREKRQQICHQDKSSIPWRFRQGIIHLFKLIVCYTVIFGCYQFALTRIDSNSSPFAFTPNYLGEDNPIITSLQSRNLEEAGGRGWNVTRCSMTGFFFVAYLRIGSVSKPVWNGSLQEGSNVRLLETTPTLLSSESMC
ncbi:MAG: hypothetical protein EOP48_30150 [Sphingobacteriales bacterium]|nr:MAG: hypothetical protein EOP48_30150 [Sphingobacteriales bacterium]